MNSNQQNNYRQYWSRVPTVRQLRGICQHYRLVADRNASRDDLLCLLEENNVRMGFSSYNGRQIHLHGAIIHWIQDPESSSSSTSDADSPTSDKSSCCRYRCPDSDACCDKKNDKPAETKVDESEAADEASQPSDFGVEHEEEVEAIEC